MFNVDNEKNITMSIITKDRCQITRNSNTMYRNLKKIILSVHINMLANQQGKRLSIPFVTVFVLVRAANSVTKITLNLFPLSTGNKPSLKL